MIRLLPLGLDLGGDLLTQIAKGLTTKRIRGFRSFTIWIDVLCRHIWNGGTSYFYIHLLFEPLMWFSINKTNFFTHPWLHQHENLTSKLARLSKI
jgi:hypothetical protein